MEVKLSQQTLEHLKYFQRIGSTMKFKEGASYITIVGGDTIGVADITEVFPRDVNIYDLNEIMSLFSVMKEPVLDLSEENVIIIKSDDLKLRYIEGAATAIKTLKSKPTLAQLPSRDVELSLSHDIVKRMNTVISTLKLPFVGFESDGDGNIYFKGFNKNFDSSNEELNSCRILICENTSEFEKFSFVLDRNVLNYLVADTTVYLSAHKLSMFDFGDRQVFVTGNSDLTQFGN